MTAKQLNAAFVYILLSKVMTASLFVLADNQAGSKLQMSSVSPTNPLQSKVNQVNGQIGPHNMIEINHQPGSKNKLPFSISKISLKPIGAPIAQITSPTQFTAGKVIPANPANKLGKDIFVQNTDRKPIENQLNPGAQIVTNPATSSQNPISFSHSPFYQNQMTPSSSIPTNIASSATQNTVQPITNIPRTSQMVVSNQGQVFQSHNPAVPIQSNSIPIQSNSIPMQYQPNQMQQFFNAAPQMQSSRPSSLKLLLPLLLNMLQEKSYCPCNCGCSRNVDREPNCQSIYDSQVQKAFDVDQDEIDPYIYPGVLKQRNPLKKPSMEDEECKQDSCENESD